MKKNKKTEEVKKVVNTPEQEELKEETQNSQETENVDIEKLQQEIEQLKTEMLYKQAEFENYRKRTIKEKTELILNGGEKTITALLPVLDDMERAEQNMEKSDNVEALKEGLELVFHNLIKILEGQGLKKIEAKGEDFDTNFHEAIAMVPGKDEDKGKVIDCVQNGYTLNDKVIRYAKVAIGQ